MKTDTNGSIRDDPMLMFKTIDIRQKGVKKLQRKLIAHKNELTVHRDHLSDLLNDVSRTIHTLDEARKDIESAIDHLNNM